jgi:hypothetical protein
VKSKRFLVCIADRLTPKMRRSLKLEVKEKKLDDIKGYCREKKLAFDIIPINATNFGRIAVVMNQVKSIKQ